MVKVVAALIEKDGKVLIAKRATGNEALIGKWEFPGGKVEANETEEAAIEREIKEEFELEIKANEFLVNNECKYPKRTIDLRLYSCNYLRGNFKLHDHSEYVWVSPNKLLDYDLAPADVPLAEYVINTSKSLTIEDLVVGDKYTNEDIAKAFKCSNMGGMRRSKETNSLVLIVKHTNPLYDDEWAEDGILYYTGMGTVGDQSIEFAQNKTLATAKKQGIKVYLFESYKDNEYYFNGEVELAGDITTALETDAKDNMRKVLKYPLKLKNESTKIIIDEKSLKSCIEQKQKEAKKIPCEELRKTAIKMENRTYTKKVITIYRERNAVITEYTKQRAKGICDLCGVEAPFKNKERRTIFRMSPCNHIGRRRTGCCV